jgi:GntR family transcriptional regulator, transcriptional repressor for pyruvate dehydrogenase complex
VSTTTKSLARRPNPIHASKLPEVKRASQVLSKLRALIAEHPYQPGMKLPPERLLAQKWRVGRPAVREAIKALTMLDVLESRRGDGTYVKSLGGLSVGWAAKVEEFKASFDMVELLEVRKMIEPKAAGLSAVRATARQINEIREEILVQERHHDNRHLMARHDFRFHDAIINAAGNHVLADLNRILAPLLLKSRSITAATAPDMIQMIREHWKIFDAIAHGQSDLAERAMLDHLHTVGLDLISARSR